MRVFVPLSLILLLSACSRLLLKRRSKNLKNRPLQSADVGISTDLSGRASWAGDSLPLRIRSINLTDVPSEAGKAGAWEITYVSPSQQAARIYTWSAIEASGSLHKDIFAGKAQAWSPSGGQEKPFAGERLSASILRRRLKRPGPSPKLILDKPGEKPAINFWWSSRRRFPNPVWRVMWGETAGSAKYTVFVDAATGQMVGKSLTGFLRTPNLDHRDQRIGRLRGSGRTNPLGHLGVQAGDEGFDLPLHLAPSSRACSG